MTINAHLSLRIIAESVLKPFEDRVRKYSSLIGQSVELGGDK